MILKLIRGTSKAILDSAHYNKTGALAGFLAGAVLGVAGAVVIQRLASPDGSLAMRCIGMGALFALLGAVLVAQWTYHASGTGDPRVIDLPRPPKRK
jgi:hypothetical protein